MPYKEREINRLYYTMGQLSAMFGVNPSQIRFYDMECGVLRPGRNKKGNRVFTKEDISTLKIIFNLVIEKGYTLQRARDYLKSNKSEAKENQRVIDSLERLKSFLQEVRDSL